MWGFQGKVSQSLITCDDFLATLSDRGRSPNGQWTGMHDCKHLGPGYRISTSKKVVISENGRVVRDRAVVVNEEFTQALVFNPLAATFAGIADTLGIGMYIIDTSLCLSIVSLSLLLLHES